MSRLKANPSITFAACVLLVSFSFTVRQLQKIQAPSSSLFPEDALMLEPMLSTPEIKLHRQKEDPLKAYIAARRAKRGNKDTRAVAAEDRSSQIESHNSKIENGNKDNASPPALESYMKARKARRAKAKNEHSNSQPSKKESDYHNQKKEDAAPPPAFESYIQARKARQAKAASNTANQKLPPSHIPTDAANKTAKLSVKIQHVLPWQQRAPSATASFHQNLHPASSLSPPAPAPLPASSSTETFNHSQKVYYLHYPEQLSLMDAYAGSWLQTCHDFMTMPLAEIENLEDASFIAYRGEGRIDKLRMTLDWLDLSVEHLSKWWTMLDVYSKGHEIPFDVACSKLEGYIQQSNSTVQYAAPNDNSIENNLDTTRNASPWDNTIAVVAYYPFGGSHRTEKHDKITSLSLAATLESIRRAGFGRAVVVGVNKEDKANVQATLHYMSQYMSSQTSKYDKSIIRLGHMEVNFVLGNKNTAETKYKKHNVPKAAFDGLLAAFQIANKQKPTAEELDHMQEWLGKKHASTFWKYIYYTEQDSVLQTRPETLQELKEELDRGSVLVPHRFQPIPHELDVHGFEKDWRYLPASGDFSQVLQLDASKNQCCDEQKGPDMKPGQPPAFPECGNFWYMCDFHAIKPDVLPTHNRLKQYNLVSFTQGTGTVHIAGNEHGRRCFPPKNSSFSEGVCQPAQ